MRRRIDCSGFSLVANSVLIILILFSVLPTSSAFAQVTAPTHTISECKDVEEELLLGELNRISRSVLVEGKSGLDVGKIVSDNWMALDLDGTVDSAVDNAVERVREEEGTWARIFSGWSEGKAREFAEKVAEYAFGSPEFRGAFDQLSIAVATDLEVEIHIMTVKSASATLLCVQEFVEATFSKTMSVELERSIRVKLADANIEKAEGQVDIDILRGHTASLTGIGTIVGTQIAHKLAQKVAQGILGKVATRILGKAATAVVPVAGWVIGGALIIFDLYKAWDGSLPQIQKDFKGQEVKETIRQEITTVVEEELKNAMPEISESVTIDILGKWKAFLQEFDLVLRLAESNARFRAIVDEVTVDQVDKLTELVSVGEKALGRKWLLRIIDSGEFKRILDLPEDSFKILRDKADPELVLAWADLADEMLVPVVRTESYKFASPSDFKDRETLERALALEEPALIRELMQLSEPERAALLQLPTPQTIWILTELSDEERDWLASYLTVLPNSAPEIFMETVMRAPALIGKLLDSEQFQSELHRVLELAQTVQDFKLILNGLNAEEVAKLTILVAVTDEVMEHHQLVISIESGQLESILALPLEAFEILRLDGGPELVLAWNDLAGESILQVVSAKLHQVSLPADFTGREELERVLAIQDAEAIHRLMTLERGGRDVFLELPTGLTRMALISFAEDEVSWLADHLLNYSPDDREQLADRIIREPALLPHLRLSEIRRALWESPNAQKALEQIATRKNDGSSAEMVEETPEEELASTDGPIAIVVLSIAGLLSLWIVWQNYQRRQTNAEGTVNRTSRGRK